MRTPSAHPIVVPPPLESTSVASNRPTCPEDLRPSAHGRVDSAHTILDLSHSQSQQPSSPSTNGDRPLHVASREQADVERMDAEEDGLLRDSPSPISAVDESTDCDHRSTPSSANSSTFLHEYPTLTESPFPRVRFLPNSTSSFLRPGSRFRGTQESEHKTYNVEVELQHVDMAESFLCGYLRIQDLTANHPTLITYFEGEIIGTKYTFPTKHVEWGSNEKLDMQYWARFPAWRPLAKQARKPDFNFRNFAQRENVFMRWKEHFLVPDHRVRTISGASYEGFYYICFNQVNGTVSGIYFHAKSERHQELSLKHIPNHGCTGAIEFR